MADGENRTRGGGVNALRGHSKIQGATDMGRYFRHSAGLFAVAESLPTRRLATYLQDYADDLEARSVGLFQLLVEHVEVRRVVPEAMYGNAATKEVDYAFHYLPKIDRNYSWVNIWNDMYEGKVKGIFAFGMNRRDDRAGFSEKH